MSKHMFNDKKPSSLITNLCELARETFAPTQ